MRLRTGSQLIWVPDVGARFKTHCLVKLAIYQLLQALLSYTGELNSPAIYASTSTEDLCVVVEIPNVVPHNLCRILFLVLTFAAKLVKCFL